MSGPDIDPMSGEPISEEIDEVHPQVIWLGKQPLEPKAAMLCRLVYRGPPRAGRPDDVPFSVERRTGVNMMKKSNWSFPSDQHSSREALWALSHAFGLVLMADPAKLVPGHPIHCELNMAVIEGREAKGCDCHGPTDPMG